MIYTVTLNPAIDRTIKLNSLNAGVLNVVEEALTNIGGKGINVSMVLKSFECDSIALGMAGGENGRHIAEGLKEAGIAHFFVDTGNETRTNIKIMEQDGTLTELNEKGAPVEGALVDVFIEEIKERLEADDIIILSGSVPAGVSTDIYAKLIKIAHEKGAAAILDGDGDLLLHGIEAGPDVIKPNISEFGKYLKRVGYLAEEETVGEQPEFRSESLTPSDINDYAENYNECAIVNAVKNIFGTKNISQIILSMGDKGAYFFDRNCEEYLYCNVPKVHVQSTVGAGDSVVAAWAYAMKEGYTFEESAYLAMAASAAAVETPGTKAPSRENIQAKRAGIELHRKLWRVTDVQS